eukprot:g39881.t1
MWDILRSENSALLSDGLPIKNPCNSALNSEVTVASPAHFGLCLLLHPLHNISTINLHVLSAGSSLAV